MTFGNALLLGLYLYERGQTSFTDSGRGSNEIHINDKASIHPSCVYGLSRYYGRKMPEAINEKGDGCLDEQTIGNYAVNVLLRNGNFSELDGEVEQSLVEKHLDDCDYCFNLVLDVYSLLKEMDLEKRMENL